MQTQLQTPLTLLIMLGAILYIYEELEEERGAARAGACVRVCQRVSSFGSLSRRRDVFTPHAVGILARAVAPGHGVAEFIFKKTFPY